LIEFFRDMAENPFLGRGLVAGLLASVACALLGPWVVTRRIVFLTGAVAHVALGGIGAALFLAATAPAVFGGVSALHGALLAAVAGALLIAWAHQRSAERLDTLIGAIWASGMAVGLLLIQQTPGYHGALMNYLFGQLSLVSRADLALMAVLNVVLLTGTLLVHKPLLAIALDPEQARLQGTRVGLCDAALLVLVALAVVSMVRVVGLILAIALLSLPPATAAHHVRRLPATMALAGGLCALLTTVPRAAVYGTSLAPEPVIVLGAAGAYLLSALVRRGST
jgi:zinc transport system permease protein